MSIETDLELVKKLVEKLKTNIIKGEWKFEITTDDYSDEDGSYCKIGKAEPKKEKEGSNESSTYILFEITGAHLYDRYIISYLKDNKCLLEIDDSEVLDDYLNLIDYQLYDAIKNSIEELQIVQTKYNDELKKSNFQSILDSLDTL